MELVTRKRDRQSTDEGALYELLDEQWWGVLSTPRSGAAAAGSPEVLTVPTIFVRDGDRLLMHGSTGAGLLGASGGVRPVSFCVTAMDALVLANSAFDTSVFYRSAVVYGSLRAVDAHDHERLLTRFMETLIPGRSGEVRAPTRKEFAATHVVAIDIVDGSWVYKANTGASLSAPQEDIRAWCGAVPFESGFGVPEVFPWAQDQPIPASVHNLRRPD